MVPEDPDGSLRNRAAGLRLRDATGHVATTGGVTAEEVQDSMVATVEPPYGQGNRVPDPI